MSQLKDSQTKIEEITSAPFQFAFQIEYDREVISVRVYDNWSNKTAFFSSAIDETASDLIEDAYQKVLEIKAKEGD